MASTAPRLETAASREATNRALSKEPTQIRNRKAKKEETRRSKEQEAKKSRFFVSSHSNIKIPTRDRSLNPSRDLLFSELLNLVQLVESTCKIAIKRMLSSPLFLDGKL